MAGIMNHTARQFNLKTMGDNKHRVTVRVAPGFNDVNDEHWSHFIKGKGDPYVNQLKKEGKIDFGEITDDLLLDREPDTKSKSKSSPPPVIKGDQDLGKLTAADRIKAKAEMMAEIKAEIKAEMMAEMKAEMKAKVKEIEATVEDDGLGDDDGLGEPDKKLTAKEKREAKKKDK